MVKVLTDQGEIGISNAVFTTITGAAATNCFGVKGMAYRSMTDGIVHLLRPEAMSKRALLPLPARETQRAFAILYYVSQKPTVRLTHSPFACVTLQKQ